MRNKIPKVCILPADNATVGKLRLIQPFLEMKKQGLITEDSLAIVEKQSEFVNDLPEKLKDVDVFWFHSRLIYLFLWEIVNARMLNPKLRLIVDIDDNIFNVQPWNPAIANYAVENLMIDKTLYKFDLSKNLLMRRVAEVQFDEADALSVTAPLLAACYHEYNKNIYVQPNCLDWELWNHPHVGQRFLNRVILGWQGGNTHLNDWGLCHPAIVQILHSRPDVYLELCTCVSLMSPYIKTLPKEKLMTHEFIDYEAHPFRSNLLRPDIGLCPLDEDAFNICKSDLKYTEYAAMRVPVIASNCAPYNRVIKQGETGFLADSPIEWSACINKLASDPELRKRIGENAYQWAYQNRRLETAVKSCAEMLVEVAEQPNWTAVPSA